ncbi:M48 family metallopeptidase [soil metagenome]
MLRSLAAAVALLLASCGTTYNVPVTGQPPTPVAAPATGMPRAAPLAPAGTRPYAQARADWSRVVARVEPIAERFCREENPTRPPRHCDFTIRLVENARMPPNAYQTIGDDGRPLLVMTSTLLADTRNADEIAFVLSHEASHHIAGHLARQQANVMVGALILGTLASATIAPGTDRAQSDRIISDARGLGAFAGSRVYSQSFELEADTLGAFIAARSGYSPQTGAIMFTRTPSASGPASLWSTHPPSPQRQAVVNRAAAEIRRQQALGQAPRPALARGRL